MNRRYTARAALPALALCLLLGACSAATATPAEGERAASAADAAATAAATAPAAAPSPAAAPTAPPNPAIDPAQPCTRLAPAGEAAAQPAPAEIVAGFDGGENTIVLSGGAGVTLPALSQAIDNPEALREVAPGEWLLGANLEIIDGASLQLSAPTVRWLKLRTDAAGFAAVTARGGKLAIDGVCITSWDEERGQADLDHKDGRGYLLARSGGEMVIDRAELRFLGYDANESYGLSWRLEGTVGRISDSIVSHLYYGMYSYEVNDLVIEDSEFHDNVLYGIDPHTGSHRLRIERNVVHNNGKHGIILADNCDDSVIRDNVVYNNLHHGIVLYQHSDRNLVEGNQSFRNGSQGININESADNTVRGNTVYENLEAGVGVGQGAKNNLVERNEIRANQEDGVLLYSEAADTTLSDNQIGDNQRYGVYVDTDGGARLAGNTIFGSEAGVHLKGAAEVSPDTNKLYGNREGDITNG